MSTIGTNSLSSGTGLDVGAVVDQLIYTESAPERLWQAQQQMLNAQASALRDLNSRMETLESRTNSLKDISGALSSRTVTLSDSSALSATADSTAAYGKHSIKITQLATTASQYSDPPIATDGTFAEGDLKFQIGGREVQTISFDAEHNTLPKAADYINSLNLGVKASVVNDALGSRLTVVSETSGAAGNLTIIASPDGLGFKTGVAGVNAKFTVDGVPLESATNTITGVLPGVSFELQGETGTNEVSLTVAPDTGRAKQAIQDWVASYNSLIDNISAHFTYNETTKSAGVLAGNSSVRSVQQQLLTLASFQLSGNASRTTLRSVGIEMSNDGKFTVNDSVLDTALKQDVAGVTSFFQSADPPGFARTMADKLGSLTDSVDGPLLLDAKGMDQSNKTLARQIEDFEVRLDARREALTAMYTKIDTMLRQLPLLQAQISGQLEALK